MSYGQGKEFDWLPFIFFLTSYTIGVLGFWGTATGGNLEDNTAPKVNRTWYAPKKSDQFMQPSGSESVYDKSERRALELRSKRKAQLLEQSRSKMRANAETDTGHEEQKEPPQALNNI